MSNFPIKRRVTHEYVLKELDFLLSYYYGEYSTNDWSDEHLFEKVRTEADHKRVTSFDPSIIFMLPPAVESNDTLNEWCRANTNSKWGKLDTIRFWWFESETDAVAFFLTWC